MIWTLVQVWVAQVTGCRVFEDWSAICGGFWPMHVPW